MLFPKPKHKRGTQKRADRGRITPEVYEEVMERADGVCEWCGKSPEYGTRRDRLEAAHLVQRSQGGRGDDPANIAALCGPSVNTGTCHNKADYTAAGREWRMEFAKELAERYGSEE